MQELSGTDVPASRPFIGDGAYTIESGIPAAWYRNIYDKYPTMLFPVRPEFVGHEVPQIVMGKKSGLDSVRIKADELGLAVSEERRPELLATVKRLGAKKRGLVTDDEFRALVEKGD